MNLFFWAVLATVSLVAFGSPVEKVPTVVRASQSKIDELRKRVDAIGGCNANVCFAIDGSGSISGTEFTKEKNFVLDVVSVIAVDQKVELAAVQYGLASSAISPLTTNVGDFILKVDREPHLRAPQTFLVAGINYCFSQLFRRQGEANKMVVLGDGRSTIGADAVARADLFRSVTGGKVCAVGAGFEDTKELLAIAGGNKSQLFTVDSFLDVLALEAILEKLVQGICGPL